MYDLYIYFNFGVSIVVVCFVYAFILKRFVKKDYIVDDLKDIRKYHIHHILRMTMILFWVLFSFIMTSKFIDCILYEDIIDIKEVVTDTLRLTAGMSLFYILFMPVSLVLEKNSNITFEIRTTSKVVEFHLKDPYNASREVIKSVPTEIKDIMLFINNKYNKFLLASPLLCNKNGDIRKPFVAQLKRKIEESKCINYKETKVKVPMLNKGSLFLGKGTKIKINSPYTVKISWNTNK